jgi:dUTP pyrophosphatase
MNVKVKKLKENAVIPTHGSPQSAGFDLYACIDEAVTIAPHQTVKIDTGLAMELPDGYFGAIFSRSGISINRGLVLGNATAVIDSDYRGSIVIGLHNDSPVEQEVLPNERIAQLVLIPYETMEFEEVDELNATERGSGGFGSTGR